MDFEETFKLGRFGLMGGDTTPKTMRKKKPESITLLEPNRVRNVGKLIKDVSVLCKSVGKM